MSLLTSVSAAVQTPIDHWLAEQADLTAVDRFVQRAETELEPRQARYYRDLLPLTAPGPGQQYAFEVDLDTCTGCKACVSACHSLNGLDEDESWRTVTLLTGTSASHPFQQSVTAACHHCLDPACLAGCPVDAYEKDPITGIVSHLDDQCIGCSYCTLTCPYEVPVFNHDRGIVRKCDMCKGRLEVGEAPACVQGCPNQAIAITVVSRDAVVAATASGAVVPGAPPSRITAPTTIYRSASGRVNDIEIAARPAAGPARAHPPLTAMLVLTQLAVGAFAADVLLRLATNRGIGADAVLDAAVAAAAGVIAIAASIFHLGRPRYGYRAVIGLRHSWLSREVVAFGAFTGVAVPYAVLVAAAPSGLGDAIRALGVVVALLGVLGVACSVLIYTTTHRSSWRPLPVASKFTVTAAVCGVAAVVWATNLSETVGRRADAGFDVERILLFALAALMVAKLAGEAAGFRHLVRPTHAEGVRRARLLTRDLAPTTSRRFVVGGVAGVALPVLAATTEWIGLPGWLRLVGATVVLAGVVVGELLERSLFFTAASPPR